MKYYYSVSVNIENCIQSYKCTQNIKMLMLVAKNHNYIIGV